MEHLDGSAVRRWASAGEAALRVARSRIDAVNVFPVADADTGTNVLLTLTGAAEAVAVAAGDDGAATRAATGAGVVARQLAQGAVLSARGNSGVILSQYLQGGAQTLGDRVGPAELARALTAAGAAAQGAVAQPQEGTVLTIARVVAEAATRAAGEGADLDATLARATLAGHAALAGVSAEHPVLAAARVVDAGACALLVLLDALLAVVRAGAGETGPVPLPDLTWLPEGEVLHGHGGQSGGVGGGAFEVMMLVRAPEPARLEAGAGAEADGSVPVLREQLHGRLEARLQARLQEVGDSVAVVAGVGVCQAHVHTDVPALAVRAGGLGAREQVVVRLVDHGGQVAADTLGIVACTESADLAGAHALAGAVVLVRCDGVGITARHLVRAILDTGTAHVVVLPVDEATAAAAREAASVLEATSTTVEVLGVHGTRTDGPDLRGELGAAVAVLALQGTGAVPAGERVEAARAALTRLRSTGVPADLTEALAAAAGLLASARTPTAPTLTVLTGPDVGPALRAAFETGLAETYPDLAVLGTGPVDGIDGFLMGVE